MRNSSVKRVHRSSFSGVACGLCLVACGLLLLTCSPKYFIRGNLAPDFNKARTYKTAILPFLVRGEAGEPNSILRDRAYSYLNDRLMEAGKFMMIDKFTIDQAVRVHQFGQMSGVDPVLARQIGQEAGAELVVVPELSLTPVEGSGLRILCNVQIYDVNGEHVMYDGQGRTDNPVVEAGAEFAVDLATRKLVSALK
jgi:hypothetical protein